MILRSIFILIMFSTSILFAQRSDTSNQDNSHSFRTTRFIMGISGVYGVRAGLGINITNYSSIEITGGYFSDINVAGPRYSMIFYGFVVNGYFLQHQSRAIIVSILFSRANVTRKSYEYTGDFTYIAPMIGGDISFQSGFGLFLRVGPAFATENYRLQSPKVSVDFGLCWSFN
jgi:hypothetical protein